MENSFTMSVDRPGDSCRLGHMKKNKRPQAPKVRNEALSRAMQEKRQSNAAGTHKSARDYRRKPKHFKGWD